MPATCSTPEGVTDLLTQMVQFDPDAWKTAQRPKASLICSHTDAEHPAAVA